MDVTLALGDCCGAKTSRAAGVWELGGRNGISRLPPSAISLLPCRLKALEDRWGVIWKGLSTF